MTIKELYGEKIADMFEEASQIHESVNQKYDGNKPYSVHLESVLINSMDYGKDLEPFEDYKEVIAFAACFHDTIEDCRLTYSDVLNHARGFFNKEEDAVMATEIVYALTNEKGRNRAERANDKYYEGIRKTKFAPFVKCCDRLANYRYACSVQSSMVKCYKKEMPDFIKNVVNEQEVPLSLYNLLIQQ